VLLLALIGPSPLPTSVPGRVAVGSLAALGVWTAISLTWAPLIGPGVDAVQRILLYLAALMAAIALFQDRRVARVVEPALAFGTLVVIGYGVLERLLAAGDPQDGSFSAGGRLEQPITYWNAEGLLAALGLVLCVRLAGDGTRPVALRSAAAAASPLLGMGVYLSYSRGALAAALIGVILILAVVPTRRQLRAAVTCLAAGVVASACAAAFRGVASLEGRPADIDRDGRIVFVVLLAVSALAAFASLRTIRAERAGAGSTGLVPHAERLPLVAAGAVLLCVVGLIVGGLLETSESAGAKASRLASVSSLRYEYWRVGGEAFADNPLGGLGAGGFRVYWRQHRDVAAGVTEVHSLELEMAAELGLPGLALLLAFIGGVAVATRDALRRRAPLAVAGFAGCTVWVLHASIDWDWQVPAVTLPAILLAGAMLAEAEHPDEPSGEPPLAGESEPARAPALRM
jgi:O-antigen ligase